MPLQIGQLLNNRYKIIELLGQGGFGAVYTAWDINLDRSLAIKENLDTSPDVQRQFKQEAQILFDLTHPNLPKVIDHFTVLNQGQYLVMEFVDGEDLQEKLVNNGGPLSESEILPWIKQVCDALKYLHNQDPPIIHRDIKPANIKITPEGKAVMVDFGIAKIYNPSLKTTIGARAITPGYSPHEQYGQGSTDDRTDIYALGATLFTLLTGTEPKESIQRVIRDTLDPPEQINPSISEATAAIIKRAMQMDPEDRYQSVGSLHTEISSIPAFASSVSLSQTISQATVRLPTGEKTKSLNRLPFRKWLNRNINRIFISLAVLVLVLIIGGQMISNAAQNGITSSIIQGEESEKPLPVTNQDTLEPSLTVIPASISSTLEDNPTIVTKEENEKIEPFPITDTPTPAGTDPPTKTHAPTRTKTSSHLCVYNVKEGDTESTIGARYYERDWPQVLYPIYECNIEYRDSEKTCVSKTLLKRSSSGSGQSSYIVITGQWVWIPSLPDTSSPFYVPQTKCVSNGGEWILDLTR